MKKILIIFLTVFVVLFGVGFMNGYDLARQSTQELVQNYLEVVKSDDRIKSIHLEYRCKGDWMFKYDLDSLPPRYERNGIHLNFQKNQILYNQLK